MPSKSHSDAIISSPPSPPSNQAKKIDGELRKQAIRSLNRQFLTKIVDHWKNNTGHKHHNLSQLMLEYRNFSDGISNDETVLDETFRFIPSSPGLEGVAEEVVEQVAKEWNIDVSESGFGFGDMESFAPAMGMSSTAPTSKAVTLTHEMKVIDDVTDGVEKYNLGSPVRGD